MSYHRLYLYDIVEYEGRLYQIEGLMYKGPNNTCNWSPDKDFPKENADNRYYQLSGLGFDDIRYVVETELTHR